MKTSVIMSALVVALLLSLLTACGSLDNETVYYPQGDGSSAVLNGRVADGYLVGARVFLDRNGNRSLDSGEPWTISGPGGSFSLTVAEGEGDLYPVVAEVVAGQTVDEDRPGEPVPESYLLQAPLGKWGFVSPLTTLVKAELDKNPSLTMNEAEGRVRSQVGLGSNVSLFTDYVNSSELDYAHRAARIIAGLMGVLQAEIELRIDGYSLETQKAAIALMVSDEVMSNGQAIAMALDTAGDAADLEGILTVLLAEIDTFKLNQDLLERYAAKMQEPNPVWEMTSPEIVRQSPGADGSAPVDAVISFAFTEELDPASLRDTSVQVTGPWGQVPGTVVYDPALKEISFIPQDYLSAFSSYQVALAGVTDLHGNPVPQNQQWSFTTIFDQVPPELPEFGY